MKFREGDLVYCIKPSLEDTKTEYLCGLDGDMELACAGFPMTVESRPQIDGPVSYLLSAPQFAGKRWWFHEDDLEHFNLSLENK